MIRLELAACLGNRCLVGSHGHTALCVVGYVLVLWRGKVVGGWVQVRALPEAGALKPAQYLEMLTGDSDSGINRGEQAGRHQD